MKSVRLFKSPGILAVNIPFSIFKENMGPNLGVDF